MSRLRLDPPGTRPWLLDRRGRERLRAADDAAADDAKVAAFSGSLRRGLTYDEVCADLSAACASWALEVELRCAAGVVEAYDRVIAQGGPFASALKGAVIAGAHGVIEEGQGWR